MAARIRASQVGRHKSCGNQIRDRHPLLKHILRETNTSSSAMSYNLKQTQDGPSSPTPEERKGLLSNFDIEDHDNGESPRYEDEEHAKPRERTPLRKRRILWIAGGLIALTLGASFLVPLSRTLCGGMGAISRPTDPSKLFSNGTHEFKRTVLIVSIDGLR